VTRRRSPVRWLARLARNLVRGSAADADLAADVRSYVDLLTDEKIAAGMSLDAARRAALLELGGVEAVKEETRVVRAGALLAEVWQDARYTVRAARRDAGFHAVVVLTLALGIGANTAIFSVVNAVLLEPLPYPDPDRLVLAWERNSAIGKERDRAAALNYLEWRTQSTAFEQLGAYRMTGAVLSGVDHPEALSVVAMTSSAFRVLGVSAAAGRTFTDDEEQRRDRVVVLGHSLWQRRFAGDAGIVGRSIALGGAAATVVGIMPPAFRFPEGIPADLYTPLLLGREDLAGRGLHQLSVIGRLGADSTIEEARAELGTIARNITLQDPASNPEVTLERAHDVLVEDVRLGLLTLLGTVGFVLLIASANVANLLLVRGASRRDEIAVRTALGAGGRRLIRQLLTESMLLALLGGAAGVMVAWSLLALLVRYQPPDLVRVDQVALDTPVLLFTLAVAVLTGIIFGVAPALQVLRPLPPRATRASTRSLLLVVEISSSLILLVGAGLMIRSLVNAQNADLGFDGTGVLSAQLSLAPSKYGPDPSQLRPRPADAPPVPDAQIAVFFTRLVEELRAVPGVRSAAVVSSLPLNPVGIDYDLPVVVEGRPRPRPGEDPQADFRIATPAYFETMGIPLVSGREFNEFDGPNSTPVVIINETMAKAIFPGEDPLRHRILLYGRPRQIVGVVGSVRHGGFSRDFRFEMIVPLRQRQFSSMTLVVRSSLAEAELVSAVRDAVHAIDPEQPLSRVRWIDQFVADSVARPRFTTFLLAAFATLALTLALVGVYSVMSFVVGRRTREIGVRMALGARRSAVVWMVVRQGMGIAVVGVAVGVAGALAGTRLMAGMLFGVTATDPAAFAIAVAALAVTSFGATCVPALRAARVAPATALKVDLIASMH
jgi:predicted permease